MTDLIKAALAVGAKQSIALWKDKIAAEQDLAWKEIALDIAVDDAVSLAATELGYDLWDNRSFEVDGRRVGVNNEAWFALREEWKRADIAVGARFMNRDGKICKITEKVVLPSGVVWVSADYGSSVLKADIDYVIGKLENDGYKLGGTLR